MLNGHAADSQLGGILIQPLLHPFQHIFVFPSANPALVVNRLRIGGTNHDAAGQAPAGFSLEALTSEWALNPDTGLPWTWADLASLEVGFAGSN